MGDPQHPNQKYAEIDLGIAVAHLCYAAKQQGLSTCIMGAFDKKMLLEGLGITEEKRVRLVLSVGYAANDQLRTKKRKPLEQINLNCSCVGLVENRLRALQTMLRELKKKHPKGDITLTCSRMLEKYQSQTPKTPYLGILMWWLQKHMSKG